MLEQMLSTPKKIQEMVDRHPEKAELWKSELNALEILQDPEAPSAEIRSAAAKMSSLKGQLLEWAVKDLLSDSGLSVESKQRVVDGKSGGTRPDAIAKNETEKPISAFGVTVNSGGTMSVECKCGRRSYLENQLKNHIPNQLSGQEGTRVLLATEDIYDTSPGLAESVCKEHSAELVVPNIHTSDVEKAIKEVTLP